MSLRLQRSRTTMEEEAIQNNFVIVYIDLSSVNPSIESSLDTHLIQSIRISKVS